MRGSGNRQTGDALEDGGVKLCIQPVKCILPRGTPVTGTPTALCYNLPSPLSAQRFAQSSLFKRTVLEHIAADLLAMHFTPDPSVHGASGGHHTWQLCRFATAEALQGWPCTLHQTPLCTAHQVHLC